MGGTQTVLFVCHPFLAVVFYQLIVHPDQFVPIRNPGAGGTAFYDKTMDGNAVKREYVSMFDSKNRTLSAYESVNEDEFKLIPGGE